MSQYEELPLGALPTPTIDAASQELADYSIGFVRIEAQKPDAILLGSGTLVSLGPLRAVLTADHVLEILPKTGRLGLILGSSPQPTTVDTAGVSYVPIDRGTVDADGPDLGVILLAPGIAGTVASKKLFYNLETHRDRLLNSPPHPHDGIWFVNGFIGERTIEERSQDGNSVIKGFYNLSGAGGPEDSFIVGGYDYFACLVTYDSNHNPPRSFGGMSGGGLWQMRLMKDAHGHITHGTPLLSGVVFYQQAVSDTSLKVKCHGRRSVYEVVYEVLRRAGS